AIRKGFISVEIYAMHFYFLIFGYIYNDDFIVCFGTILFSRDIYFWIKKRLFPEKFFDCSAGSFQEVFINDPAGTGVQTLLYFFFFPLLQPFDFNACKARPLPDTYLYINVFSLKSFLI